jgi:23S rRNA (uracil1939-C5)-methyltransferase
MSRPRRPKRPPRPNRSPSRFSIAAGVEATLDIVEVGARGDGVAARADGEPPVYVPFTLPGERVQARVAGERGALLAVESASPERVSAPCPHFGRCGGCQLQHWAEPGYLAWKREEVVCALGRRGIEAPVAPVVPAWGEGRRRAAFHAQRRDDAVVLGFLERASARLSPIETCPVLAPPLARALPGLRQLAEAFAPSRGAISLQCLWSETGLDVDVQGAGSPDGLGPAQLESAARLAGALDLTRLAFDGEALLTRRPPLVTMGRAQVAPPPGAFLQATKAGELALARLALDAVGDAKRIADLFSGVGTFALRLCDQAEVHAAEAEAAMLAALAHAAGGLKGARPITVETRDLMREPLTAAELSRFDAVVVDPPRAGARAQAEEIARSKVARVAAVSCDPATFARDVRILLDAGFALTRVTPVDQFRWSPHVEVVGALAR